MGKRVERKTREKLEIAGIGWIAPVKETLMPVNKKVYGTKVVVKRGTNFKGSRRERQNGRLAMLENNKRKVTRQYRRQLIQLHSERKFNVD